MNGICSIPSRSRRAIARRATARWRGRGLLGGLGAICLGGTVALAEPAPAPAAALSQSEKNASVHSARLEVTVAADPARAAALEEVLEELLLRVDVALELRRVEQLDYREIVTPRTDAQPALGRVWIELWGEAEVAIFFADGEWERILIRRLPNEARSDEVVREELSAIVLANVETLQSGGRVGAPRAEVVASLGVEPTEPSPPPEVEPRPSEKKPLPASPQPAASNRPPPNPEPPLRFRAGAGYGLESFAPEQRWSHQLWIHASALWREMALGLDLGSAIPVSVEAQGIELELRETSMLAHAGRLLWQRAGFRSELQLGLGARLTSFEVSDPMSLAEFSVGSETRFDPVASVFLVGTYRLLSRLHARLDLGVNWTNRRTGYVIELETTERVSLLRPEALRPLLRFGVSWF